MGNKFVEQVYLSLLKLKHFLHVVNFGVNLPLQQLGLFFLGVQVTTLRMFTWPYAGGCSSWSVTIILHLMEGV